MTLLGIPSMDMLQRSHRKWVEESLIAQGNRRDGKWSESIAVGSKGFVAMMKKQLGLRARGRKMTELSDDVQLRETQLPYSAISGGENGRLSSENLCLWDVYPAKRNG